VHATSVGLISSSSTVSSARIALQRCRQLTDARLETMDEVLPNMNKTILGTNAKPVDLQFVKK
jgi:hypothetical protein